MSVIVVQKKVLQRNDELAAVNRERLRAAGLFTLNLVSSPGAGKTTLLEKTLARLQGRVRIGVVEGDVQTDIDAQRIARTGAPVVQIVTDGACHLEAKTVGEALNALPLAELDVVVIENVGNLVCPAAYDLGEDAKVVLLSTPEGEEKPLKYPAMFRNASVLVLTKTDLVPHLPCDLGKLRENALRINPDLAIFEVSATTGEGLDAWCSWIEASARSRR